MDIIASNMIAVTDKLPDNDDDMLVLDEAKNEFTKAWYDIESECWCSSEGGDSSLKGYWASGDDFVVTHWNPLGLRGES